MEFRILGPLEVVDEGRPVKLDRKRLRALLGYFLLHANELVTSDRLIDEVWGPDPPKTASASLQNHISRLRKAVGAGAIVSEPGGYVLRVDPERFDLARFERLTAEAHAAEPRERAEKLRAALSLWRGPALEDLAFESFALDEVRRLEEARLAAHAERIDADLELGRDDLVGELEELVDRHPLRERFRGQLMRALYRAGRQADALAEYQKTRSVLMDQLGLEPSEELRALQQAILKQDAALGPTNVDTPQRTPDRRIVTVLFCDIVGSTELAHRLDPEAYRVLMERYLVAVRAPIERHGGTVEKFIGDAVMAVFGVPDLHEDDSLRAVRAAADVREVLRELDELAAAEWGVRLAGRIGVNTGEVHVVSSAGQDLRLTGATVNVASRLEERAPPGGILLGDETVRLVRDAVRVERLGSAWLLEEVVAGASAYARRLDAALVGRDAELARLRSAYEHAREEQRCRVVTVIGEAGIGKTRLIRELADSVDEEARVLVGRCVSYGEGASYLPIAEVMRQAVPELSPRAIAALVGGEDADQVAQRLAELTGVSEGAAAAGEAFWAVRRFVEAIGRERPLLLVFDDIHWAEPTLLDLIEYLGKWAEGPILVVCAARGDLREARPAWGGPTSTGFVVELGPLAPQEVSALLSTLAGERPPAELEERVVQHAGGNPLFAEQLLALAAEQPELALDPPPTIEALLASRFDRLDPHELQVLRRASVIGRRFSWDELIGVTPRADRARTKQQLAALIERGFVHPAEELYRFHHVLVRDVAYRGLPKAERAELHELAATMLERRDDVDELVGFHFEQAHRYLTELARKDPHTTELATAGGERLGHAGLRAWRRADAPAAANLLGRAVALLPSESRLGRELACELGVALRMRGDWEGSLAVLEEAVERSVAATDRSVELRARLELANLKVQRDPRRTPASELIDAAAAAIPVFESSGDDRGLSRAWLLLGSAQGAHGHNSLWEDAAARAAEYYCRAGWSPSTSLNALGAAMYHGPKPVPDAIHLCENLLETHTDRASQANVLLWLGGLCAMRERFDEGRRLVERARANFEELGQATAVEILCEFVASEIELLASQSDAAEEALRACSEASRRLGESATLGWCGAQLAECLYARGRFDEAAVWARTARETAADDDLDAQSQWRGIAAKLAGQRGDRGAAEALAREAVEIAAQTDSLNLRAGCLLALAEVLRVPGREQEAVSVARDALQLLEAKGNKARAGQVRTSFDAAVSV